ncbi:MAG TPA: aminotransferase class III-fold pyridoxal phosphate-dependent enzyme [Planctomycetaceae bacterium]|jgi:putrescine aminotransferase|nr:aminotransferase class III-fold pyridoxal phosphate-dependent enzyme [Planctomycetaceae bacterium]
MRFAFLVHPVADSAAQFIKLDEGGVLRKLWGADPLRLTGALHKVVQQVMASADEPQAAEVRIIDELPNLVTPRGATAHGRLYEIPMGAMAILEDPDRALGHIQQAVQQAVDWGARIIGLGSMTGIVGGRGTIIAEQSPVAVTTGNSLTAYTALQNVFETAAELNIDLAQETVAVVGIPGSIASVAATLIAPHCGRLILVGRRASGPAQRLANQLSAEFITDVAEALKQATIVISATSSGSCIEQAWLQPGTLVVDVGVPTDVRGSAAERDDVLILTGGLIRVPDAMAQASRMLWFQHGMIPSCLSETMLLALEEREECFSLGRELQPEAVQEIGSIARNHGFDFSRLYSFGCPLSDDALVRFQKTRARIASNSRRPGIDGSRQAAPPTPKQLADRAAKLYARYINPVLMAMNGASGLLETFVRGEGEYLYDAAGKKYLDFVAGFGSLNFGHNHPAVAAAVNTAIREQAPGFTPTSVNPYAAALAEKLVSRAPSGLEMVFFCNSGTEAVEASIKLARAATGRTGLLSCDGAFHGKSMGSLSVTGNPAYQRAFQPLLGDCQRIPYGDFEALERTLATRRFAAFIVEPIQAEGGIRMARAGYLREAQAICRSTETLLIVDEVQTGMGRTGMTFAVEHEDVHPDAMTLAKSLGGGLMPIGAMLARRDLWMKAYGTVGNCTLHTSTFGGGSLATAAGLAALDVLENERLAENAARRGEQLLEGLSQIAKRFRCVKQVRGRGLLLGVEFNPLQANVKSHWLAIDPTGMARFIASEVGQMIDAFHVLHAMQTLMQGHSIYTQFTRSNPLVLRIEPPLTITEAQTQEFLTAFEKTCEEIDFIVSIIGEMIAKTSVGKHDAAQRAGFTPADAAQ